MLEFSYLAHDIAALKFVKVAGLPESVGFGYSLCNRRKDTIKVLKWAIFSKKSVLYFRLFDVQNALFKTPCLKGQ